jgi:phosphatidylinositol 4-kinase
LIEDIKASSPYQKFPSHSIKAFIAKSNDDLRQELLTMQLIRIFHEIFAVREGLFVTPYEILITSATSGLIEFLPDTISMDALKKKLYKKTNQSLRSFFKEFFKENLNEALINFAGSLAAYSLICYFLQIKDRHNGNILLDINAKLIHIDFGFILGISPGNNFKFETAPFKFTKDYIDILGGIKSLYFTYFRTKFLEGFITARKHYERFESVLKAMTCTNNGIPCFEGRNAKEVLREFRLRFFLGIKQSELMVKVDELIEEAIKNKRTGQYDWYQYLTNGIYY